MNEDSDITDLMLNIAEMWLVRVLVGKDKENKGINRSCYHQNIAIFIKITLKIYTDFVKKS